MHNSNLEKFFFEGKFVLLLGQFTVFSEIVAQGYYYFNLPGGWATISAWAIISAWVTIISTHLRAKNIGIKIHEMDNFLSNYGTNYSHWPVSQCKQESIM